MFSWTALSSSGTKPSQPNRTVTVGRKTIIAAAHQYYVFARGPPNGDRSAGKIVTSIPYAKLRFFATSSSAITTPRAIRCREPPECFSSPVSDPWIVHA